MATRAKIEILQKTRSEGSYFPDFGIMKGKARKVKSERVGAGRPGPYPSNITDARRNQPFLEPIVVTSSATASFAGLSNEDCGVGISTEIFFSRNLRTGTIILGLRCQGDHI